VEVVKEVVKEYVQVENTERVPTFKIIHRSHCSRVNRTDSESSCWLYNAKTTY
jgi:hypothetical protein